MHVVQGFCVFGVLVFQMEIEFSKLMIIIWILQLSGKSFESFFLHQKVRIQSQ